MVNEFKSINKTQMIVKAYQMIEFDRYRRSAPPKKIVID